MPNWPIRLGRIDAVEWSTVASLEPVLINAGIYSSAIYSCIDQSVAQENLVTLASTPQNQAIKWSNEPEIYAKDRKESRKDGEREGEKKKNEHPYVFISPTCEVAFEGQKTESVPNWPIRLARIDAGEWSTVASLEPVLINPGIYSSAIYSCIDQNVAQENLVTLASTPQNQAIKWSNESEIYAKERKESRKDGEREGEKKKLSILMFLYHRL